MSSIDERVVEMKFENKNFEAGVSTYLKSIEKLKQGLNFEESVKGLKNLQNAGNAFSLGGIGDAFGSVGIKIDAWSIAAITAIQRVTNTAINAGEKLIKSLSVDNISAGWEKFGQKTTATATLLAQGFDEGTVYSQLDKLNWFTDETSYNFTDMIDNISKFTAAGQELTPSVKAMEGIAEWAALSGQNATTASRAMYQLSQAMGSYVKREDYKSIQTANMDTTEFRQTAIDTAIALGTLRENADGTYQSLMANTNAFTRSQFMDSLTEGMWFTPEVLVKTLEKYSSAVDTLYEYTEKTGLTASKAIEVIGDQLDDFGLKAFKAAQEARTWRDVVDSVKDAVSTKWSTIFENIIGNSKEATKVFTDLANSLYDVFAGPLDNAIEVVEEAMPSGWKKLTDVVSDAGISISDFESAIADVAVEQGYAIDDLIDKYGDYQSIFQNGAMGAKVLILALKKLSGATEEVLSISSGLAIGSKGQEVAKLQQRLADLGFELSKYGIDGVYGKETASAISAFQEANDLVVNGILDDATLAKLQDVGESSLVFDNNLLSLIYHVKDLGGRQNIIDAFWNSWDAIGKVLGTVKEAFREVFPAMDAEGLLSFTERLKAFSETLDISDETAAKLKDTFRGIFSILGIGVDIFKDLGTIAARTIKGVLQFVAPKLLTVTSSFADSAASAREWLKENNLLIRTFDTISKIVNKVLATAQKWFKAFRELPLVSDAVEKLRVAFSALGTGIGNFIANTSLNFSKWGENVKNAFSDLYERLTLLEEFDWKEIKLALKDFFKKAFDFRSLNFNGIKSFFTSFGEAISSAFNSVVNAGGNVKDWLISAYDWLKNFLTTKFSWLKGKTWHIVETILAIEVIRIIKKALNFFADLNGALTGLANQAAKFFKGLNKLVKIKRQEAISKTLLNLAILIGVIAASVVAITKLNLTFRDVQGAVLIILEILAIIAAFELVMAAINRLVNGKNGISADLDKKTIETTFDSYTGAIIAVGAAVLAIAIALKEIDKLEMADADRVEKDLWVVARIMLLIAGSVLVGSIPAAIASALSKTSISFKSLGKSFLKIAEAVWIIVDAIKRINEIDESDVDSAMDRIKAILTFLTVLNTLGNFFSGLGRVNVRSIVRGNKNKVNILSGNTGTGVLGLAAAIWIIVRVIEMLNDEVTQAEVDKAIGILWSLQGFLDAFLIVSGAATAISGLSKNGGNIGKSGDALIKMAIAIGILAWVVTLLAGLDEADVKQATDAVGQLSMFVDAMILVSGLASGLAGGNKLKIGGIIWAAIALGALAAELAIIHDKIGGEDFSLMANSLKSLGYAISIMAAVFYAIGEYSSGSFNYGTALSAFGVALLALAGIVGELWLLDSLIDDPDKLSKLMPILNDFAGIFTVLAVVMGVIGSVVGAANVSLQALGAMAAIGAGAVIMLAEFILGLAGIAWVLDQFDEETLLSGLDMLVNIGSKFGEAISSFVTNVTSGIRTAGEDIAAFADSIANIPTDFSSNMKNVGDGMLELLEIAATSQKKADKVGSRVTSILTGYAEAMTAFAENLPDAQTRAKLSLAMPTATALVDVITKISSVTGTQVFNMAQFKDDLITFSDGVKEYANNAPGPIQYAAIKRSESAVTSFIGIAELIPETYKSGFSGWWNGNTNMGQLGNQLAKLGAGLKAYCDSVHELSGDDYEKIHLSKTMFPMFFAIAEMIPEDYKSGLWGWLTGDTNLGQLGTQIGLLGSGLSAYCSAIEGLEQTDYDNVINSAASIQSFVDILTNLSALDGVKIKDLGDLSKPLKNLGEALLSYATSVDGINFQNLGASGVTWIAEGASYNAETAIQAYLGVLDKVMIRMMAKHPLFVTFGETTSGDIATGAVRNQSVIVTAFTVPLVAALMKIATYRQSFENAGSAMDVWVATGISSNTDAIGNPFSSVIRSILETLKSYYSAFYNAGYYLDLGFYNGLKDYAYMGSSAAYSIGQKAVESLNRGLEERSPSKASERSGMYLNMGLANGLLKFAYLVMNSAEEVGDIAVISMDSALSRISDFNLNPVIRPTLDLSDVQSKAGQINRMFEDSRIQGVGIYGLNGLRQNAGVTNNFYPQTMDDAQTDYFISQMNRTIGAMI